MECELKFRVAGPRDHTRVRSVLRRLGARLEGSYDEDNYRFEGPGKTTRRTTLRLRMFDGGPRSVLTAKGPARFVGGIKVREETEVEVADGNAALDLLGALGFRIIVIYRKHRSAWLLGATTVTLDTLDFGHFIEVEGPLDAIAEVARNLGLDSARALKDSYSMLARKHIAAEKKAARKGAPPAAGSSPARP